MAAAPLPLWLELDQVHSDLQLDPKTVVAAVEAVLAGEKRSFESLGIILADRETVHDLNRTFLGHDYPTDVLSFLLEPDDGVSPLQGEIYVDLDTALERGPDFDAPFEQEALRYIVHGLLHLVGYDDASDDARSAMHSLEDHYLGLR